MFQPKTSSKVLYRLLYYMVYYINQDCSIQSIVIICLQITVEVLGNQTNFGAMTGRF